MPSIRWSGVVLAAGLMIGCQATKKAENLPPPPATPEMLKEIRADYTKSNPGAVLGLVIAVRPDAHLAAVNDVSVRDFKVNDSVTFIDSAGHLLVSGVVENIVSDTLHVRYESPDEGQRAPVVGDIAVRVK